MRGDFFCAIILENFMKKGLDKIKMVPTINKTRPDQTRPDHNYTLLTGSSSRIQVKSVAGSFAGSVA